MVMYLVVLYVNRLKSWLAIKAYQDFAIGICKKYCAHFSTLI